MQRYWMLGALFALSGLLSGQETSPAETSPVETSPAETSLVENNSANSANSANSEVDSGARDLLVGIGLGRGAKPPAKASLQYALDYRRYPALVAAFLFFSQEDRQAEEQATALEDAESEPDGEDGEDGEAPKTSPKASLKARGPQVLYKQVQYTGQRRGIYGHSLLSLPPSNGLHSLPPYAAAEPHGPGLAFARVGSVLRSDILLAYMQQVGSQEQQNAVFFADLLVADSKLPARLPAARGLRIVSLEAESAEAEAFLQRVRSADSYRQGLDQAWQEYLQQEWPDVASLLEPDWQRDAFGYYRRTVQAGQGDLPAAGEDLNLVLEQLAFGGASSLTLPAIVSLGRDVLPMPFAYFVPRTAKGSEVEILCPPSAVRTHLSSLPAEQGGSRYQALLDSYRSANWLHLRYSVER